MVNPTSADSVTADLAIVHLDSGATAPAWATPSTVATQDPSPGFTVTLVGYGQQWCVSDFWDLVNPSGKRFFGENAIAQVGLTKFPDLLAIADPRDFPDKDYVLPYLGDSGGPLLWGQTSVVGVLSTTACKQSFGTSTIGGQAFYTRVAMYHSWITSHLDCGSCSDGLQNGQETGIDCGGNCPTCYPCQLLEVCGNGADDNCNGLADCADSYCQGDPSCVTCGIEGNPCCASGTPCTVAGLTCDTTNHCVLPTDPCFNVSCPSDGNKCNGPEHCANGTCASGPSLTCPADTQCYPTTGCGCVHGTVELCPYSGPPNTLNLGVCHQGAHQCVNGVWGVCVNEVVPAQENCDDGIDNSCDGLVDYADPACICHPGDHQPCYFGPAGTLGIGLCASGVQDCLVTASGTTWSGCQGQTLPAAEDCSDGLDSDCDGLVDCDDSDCASKSWCSVPSSSSSSSSSSASGGQACVAECTAGVWSCPSEVSESTCVDDSPCNLWSSPTPCGASQVCVNGLGCRPCGYAQEPCCANASCLNGGSCLGNVCGPAPCADQDGDGESSATCGGGDCDDGDPSIHHGASEACNGKDDDCDGVTDDGQPGGGLGCTTQLPGVCSAGTTACQGGSVVCVSSVGPSTEVCDGVDNDCDAQVDEGCVVNPWQIRYTPDSSVKNVVDVYAWAPGFVWQQLPCSTAAGVWTCVLPDDPGGKLQVSADVILQNNSAGWSCFAASPCAYSIRGQITLVDPSLVETPLGTAWNQSTTNDHCYSCNASLGYPVSCNPAHTPVCGP